MTGPLIAALVLGVSAALGLTAAILLTRRPVRESYLAGHRIRWVGDQPIGWADLERTLGVIDDALVVAWPARPDLRDYVVEVVPEGGAIQTPWIPVHRAAAHEVTGSIRVESWLGLGLGRRTFVAIVRRRVEGGNGLPASHSALAHEVLRHLVPYRLGLGYDAGHALAEMAAVERGVEAKLRPPAGTA